MVYLPGRDLGGIYNDWPGDGRGGLYRHQDHQLCRLRWVQQGL